MLREVPGYHNNDPIISHNNNLLPEGEDMEQENRTEHNNQFETTPNNALDDIFGSAPNSPLQTAAAAAESSHLPITGSNGDEEDLDILDATLAAPPPGQTQSTGERSDIPRLRSTHVTSGYRDGIAEAKAKYVQEGFDEGFSLGAVLGLRAGRLVGVFEGIVRAVVDLDVETASASGSAAAAAAADDDAGAGDERKGAGQKASLEQEFLTCREELGIRKLFGPEWFGEDGIWKFEVEGEDEEVTFREVAEAHPALKMWTRRIDEIAERVGLDLSPKVREEVEDEAAEEQ